QGVDQIHHGEAAGSNDPHANFHYADAGLTTAAGMRYDGVNAVSFGDPDGTMDPPVNCSGTLGMGGFFRSTTESRVVNGTTFMRILDGDVVFNDGWQGCGFYETFANFAEVATHELGHVLGLGHSTDATATMYATAHFDGRGAALKADDLAGLRSIYPVAAPAPLTLAFSTPASGATVCGMPWAVMWVDGQSGSSNTFTLTLAGQTMGTTTTGSAGPISMPYDTRTVANGSQPLTASVRDAAGNTGSATITVIVNN